MVLKLIGKNKLTAVSERNLGNSLLVLMIDIGEGGCDVWGHHSKRLTASSTKDALNWGRVVQLSVGFHPRGLAGRKRDVRT
jgi:hypothetical protein